MVRCVHWVELTSSSSQLLLLLRILERCCCPLLRILRDQLDLVLVKWNCPDFSRPMCLFYVLNLVCDKLWHCIWNYTARGRGKCKVPTLMQRKEWRDSKGTSPCCVCSLQSLRLNSSATLDDNQPVFSVTVTGTVDPKVVDRNCYFELGCRNLPWRDKQGQGRTSAIQSRDQLMALLCIYLVVPFCTLLLRTGRAAFPCNCFA